MYVVDECNIETHGMQPSVGRLAEDSDWEEAHMLRLQRMYHRDKRHACVLAWSLGNEAGYGKTHDMMAAWIRREDTSRILMYEPASYGARSAPDVTSIHPPDTPGVELSTHVLLTNNNNVEVFSALNPVSLIQAALNALFSTSTKQISEESVTTTAAPVATDIVCPMYARVEELVRLSRAFPSFPVIQCEYAHMMGEIK